MKTNPIGLLTIASLLTSWAVGQVVVVDNFNAGDFSESGILGGNFTQTGPTADLIGGTRTVNISNVGVYSTSVSGGEFNVAAATLIGAGVTVTWGNTSPLNLNLNAIPNGAFRVDVLATDLGGPALFRFFVASSLLRVSSSPTINLSQPGSYYFSFDQFNPVGLSPGANFSDIDRILFAGALPVGFAGTTSITFGSITATPVPEAGEWAMASAVGLFGFAVWRRWKKIPAAVRL